MSEEEFHAKAKRKFAAAMADCSKPVDISGVVDETEIERKHQQDMDEINRQKQILENMLAAKNQEFEKMKAEKEKEAEAERKKALVAEQKKRAEAAELRRKQEQEQREAAEEEEKKQKLLALREEEKKKKAHEEALQRKHKEEEEEEKARQEEALKRNKQDVASKAAKQKAELDAFNKLKKEMEEMQKAIDDQAESTPKKKARREKVEEDADDEEDDYEKTSKKKRNEPLIDDEADRAVVAEIAKTNNPAKIWFGSDVISAMAHETFKTIASSNKRKPKTSVEKQSIATLSSDSARDLISMVIVELVAHQGVEVEQVEGERIKNRDCADLLLLAANVSKECEAKSRAARLITLKGTRPCLKSALPLSVLLVAGAVRSGKIIASENTSLVAAFMQPGDAHASAWKFMADQSIVRATLDDPTMQKTPERVRCKTRRAIIDECHWSVVKVAEKRAEPDDKSARLEEELQKTKHRYEQEIDSTKSKLEKKSKEFETEKKRLVAVAEIPIVQINDKPKVLNPDPLPEMCGDYHRICSTTQSAFKWNIDKLVRQFDRNVIVVPNASFFELLALRRSAAQSTESTHNYLVAHTHRVCLEKKNGEPKSSHIVPAITSMIAFLRTFEKDGNADRQDSTHAINLRNAQKMAAIYVSDNWDEYDARKKQLEMEIAHVLFGFLRMDARVVDREGAQAVLENAVLIDSETHKPTKEKVVLNANELPHGVAFYMSPKHRDVLKAMWSRYCKFIGYDEDAGDGAQFLAKRKQALKKLDSSIADYSSQKKHSEDETEDYCTAVLPLMQALFPDALLGRN
jgi:hypothetical protein